jgi:hypothetical protein
MISLKRILARRRLARSLRPDPDYRERRLAQFTPERRERYFRNVRKAGL